MVQVPPGKMRMLGGLLERELTRDDPEWAAARASLTDSGKVWIKHSRRQYKENERDCRAVDQQRLSSTTQSVLMRTSFKTRELDIGTQKKTVTFEAPDQGLIEVEEKKLGARKLVWESHSEWNGLEDGHDQMDKVWSGEFRWMSRSCTSESAVETCSAVNSSVEDTSRISEVDTYSDRNSSTGNELSELAFHTLLVETRERDWDREKHQDPDSDRYLFPYEKSSTTRQMTSSW